MSFRLGTCGKDIFNLEGNFSFPTRVKKLERF